MALAVIPRDAFTDEDGHLVPAAGPPPQHWTVVDDLIWEVATWAGEDPRAVCRLGQVNWRFREAVDDSVWRDMCRYDPRLKAPPRPFNSFQQYYRAAVMQHPTSESGENTLFGPIVRGVMTNGNIAQRERAATFGDTFFPIVQVHRQTTCDLLLLDRAEHIFVGLAASGAPTTSRVLAQPHTHALFVVPYCIPGCSLTLRKERGGGTNDPGVPFRFTVTRQIQCDDEPREAVVVSEELPAEAYGWNFAFGLGAHGASCAAL